MTEFYFKQPGNLTVAVAYLPTLVTEVEGTTYTKAPNLSIYVGLFLSFFALLLALMITVLYRLKHVIAPLSTNVESGQNVRDFTSVEMCGS